MSFGKRAPAVLSILVVTVLAGRAHGATTWELDIAVPGTWGGVGGEFYTDTHAVAVFADAAATIEFLELTYTDDATVIGGGNRNYDALGLIHTSQPVDRTAAYSGRIGAWQIGRYTSFPDIMAFYARYDWGTSTFECSTWGSGTSATYTRSPLAFGADGLLHARCWFHRGDGGTIPIVSDIRIIARITCDTMPGAVLEGVARDMASATLTWKPSPAVEAVAQRVYRATDIAGPWTELQYIADNTASQYVDNTAAVDATYYYKVVAEDSGATPSADSNVVASTEVDPPTVTELRADGVLLPDGSTVFAQPTEITITFDEEMDPATITESTIRLVRAGGDGSFIEGNEIEIALAPGDVTLDGAGMIATVDLATAALPDDMYQLVVSGTEGPTANLVAHWRLDETGGTVAPDSSGNGNDGTLTNGPPWVPMGGRIGGALSFDGVDDHVNAGDPAVLNITKDLTLAAWVKLDDLASNHAMIDKVTDAGEKQYAISWDASGAELVFEYERAGNNYTLRGGTLTTEWRHVAVTVDGSLTVRMYVDGVLVASGTAPAEPQARSNPVLLGKHGGTYNSNYLDGLLDDVRIYARSLTEAEILSLATSCVTDLAGNVLDGDGDSVAGGDYVSTFTITGNPPTVATTVPADAEPAADVFSTVEITFSEAMDHALTGAAFSMDNGVTGSFSWSGETMTFRPSGSLADNTTYTITIGTGATDWDGMPMAAEHQFSFTTTDMASSGSPIETTPEGYITRMLHLGSQESDRILNGSMGTDYFLQAGLGPEYEQQASSGIAVDLSPATTSETPMVWTDLADAGADGNWCMGIADNYVMYWEIYVIAPTTRDARLYFYHDNDFKAWMDGSHVPIANVPGNTWATSSVFTLTAGTIHRFIFKLYEAGAWDQLTIRFESLSAVPMTDLRILLADHIAPVIATSYPETGATDVSRWDDISIMFSEPMDTSVDAATVATIAGGAVDGTWQWHDVKTLVWSLSSPFDPSTTYTVTVDPTKARDPTGNFLVGPNEITFTTKPGGIAPTVTSSAPDQAETNSTTTGVVLSGSDFEEGEIPHPAGALPFGGHYYEYVATGLFWPAARDDCVARGGHLVTVSSPEENEIARSLGSLVERWIGYTDSPTEGVWQWVTGEPTTHTDWNTDEPDSSVPFDDYAMMLTNGRWNDREPDNARAYVCEYDEPEAPEVRLQMSGEADIVATNVAFVDSGTLNFDVGLTGAAEGDWDILVTNPDGLWGLLPAGFAVLPLHTIRPDPVTGFAAFAMNETQVDLSWANPASPGFAGVVIFRREGSAPAFTPTDGTSYDAGSTYGDADCIYRGSSQVLADPSLSPATTYHYAIYAFDVDFTCSTASASFATTEPMPTVVTTSPVDLATDVSVDAVIGITFNKPMNKASCQAAFMINGGVTGTFAWVGNRMDFTPDVSLSYDTAYSVAVTTTATDYDGTPLDEACMFGFVTEVAAAPKEDGCAATSGGGATLLLPLALVLVALRGRKVRTLKPVKLTR